MRRLSFAFLFIGIASAQSLTLEQLEQRAFQANPAMRSADAAVRAAKGRRRQAGLYPNPIVGYTGEEITPGEVINFGEHGIFAEQRILTGGKLGIARQVADRELDVLRATAAAQRQRLRNQVRVLYYQALGEQRLLDVRRELAKLAARAVQTTVELKNVGQADQPDLLAVEVEAQRLELSLATSQNALDRTWRQLAAITASPELQPVRLEGDLDQVPRLEFEGTLARLLESSPEIQGLSALVSRNESAVRAARAAVIPDLFVRGGAHYNRERLEVNNQRVGWQGSVEIGVALPIFNRNQGTIAAARADVERSRAEVDRAKLEVRARLADLYREYRDALVISERYRTVLLPKARQAYDLYLSSFRQMAAAYPQVVITQRNLFQLQEDYVQTLVRVWQRSVEIEGLLLRGGVEMESTSPMPPMNDER
jgi:outer membrane protein, heavy metal efflux system